tara:strand:- start:85486 stop:86193 length:708 start_codon:yes stop_codon:yes gene_type:complete
LPQLILYAPGDEGGQVTHLELGSLHFVAVIGHGDKHVGTITQFTFGVESHDGAARQWRDAARYRFERAVYFHQSVPCPAHATDAARIAVDVGKAVQGFVDGDGNQSWVHRLIEVHGNKAVGLDVRCIVGGFYFLDRNRYLLRIPHRYRQTGRAHHFIGQVAHFDGDVVIPGLGGNGDGARQQGGGAGQGLLIQYLIGGVGEYRIGGEIGRQAGNGRGHLQGNGLALVDEFTAIGR